MKKMRMITTIASLALAGVLCAGFAACGSPATAEKMEGERVTEQQWRDAFTETVFENFKIEHVIEDPDERTTITVTLQGRKAEENIRYNARKYFETKSKNVPFAKAKTKEYFEQLGDIEGENLYLKNGDDPFYEVTYTDYETEFPVYRERADYLALANQYAEFEYYEEAKGYARKEYVEIRGSFDEIYIYKFKEGKLAGIWYKAENGGYSRTESSLFTYGGQKVETVTIGI